MDEINLMQILDKIGFIQEGMTYIKDDYSIYINESNKITCVINGIILFEVEINISVGTFLVLLQEYQLIHERYIYETIEGIVERFNEDEYYGNV